MFLCARIRARRVNRFGWLKLESLEVRLVPATITWLNPAGGDWNTAANWVGGIAPTAADDAVIPDLAGTPTITV